MYCARCGTQLEIQEQYCPRCGTKAERGYQNSSYYKPDYYRQTCANDSPARESHAVSKPPQNDLERPAHKSRLIAGLLALFLGLFGAHNFYLDKVRPAIGQLVFGISGFVMIFFILLLQAFFGGLLRGLEIMFLFALIIWALAAMIVVFCMIIDGLLILAGVIKINKPPQIIYGEDNYYDYV